VFCCVLATSPRRALAKCPNAKYAVSVVGNKVIVVKASPESSVVPDPEENCVSVDFDKFLQILRATKNAEEAVAYTRTNNPLVDLLIELLT